MARVIRHPTPTPRPAIVATKIENDAPHGPGYLIDADALTCTAYIRDVYAGGGESEARAVTVAIPRAAIRQLEQLFVTAGQTGGDLPPGDLEAAAARTTPES